MPIWPPFLARLWAKPDLLGFTPHATPAADEWLAAFTRHFMRYPDAPHSTQALMAGLPFYTPAFMTALAALPPGGTPQHPVAGTIPRAIYAAAGPLIARVYAQVISPQAGRAAIQAAFGRETPILVAHYTRLRH